MARKNKRSLNDKPGAASPDGQFVPITEVPAAAVAIAASETHRSWWANLGGGQRIAVIAAVLFLSLGALGAGLKYLDEAAQREQAAHAAENNFTRTQPSLLSKVNPYAAPPPPTSTPQLSKSYIYAGSRMLAVEDANAAAAPPADLAVWRPSTGYWYVLGGTGSAQTFFQWGGGDDVPAPGDYDGDGKSDFSIFRPSNGTWYVNNSSNGNTTEVTYGAGNDRLAQADYDGDGKTDPGVFRPSTGYWHIVLSSTQASVSQQFGLTNNDDIPAPADYDGDGKADLAVWRVATHTFYYQPSSGGSPMGAAMPNIAGEPVSADYDGDGKADFTVKSGTTWYLKQSSDGQTISIPWQMSVVTQQPVQNDYDGDGKVDIAVWSSTNGNWYIRQSSHIGQTNELRQEAWGQNGDYPVPAFYRR